MMALQVTNRSSWHSLVEKALATALEQHRPFTLESLLNVAGVFAWSPHRAKARLYLDELLAARNDPAIEHRERHDAAAARAVEDERRQAIHDEVESLVAGVRDKHPDVHISQLPRYLPEPQKTRLVELLAEAADWMQFPHQEEM